MIFSYSLISCFDNCPRQAHERWWLKLPVEDTPELIAGHAAHKAIEAHIENDAELPANLSNVGAIISSFIARGGQYIAEHKCAVNRQLQGVPFWDKDAYIRGSIDFLFSQGPHAFVVDWKTGKKRDKELQLMLYALLVFAHFDSIQQVTTLNYYINEREPFGEPRTWARSESAGLWRHVLPLVHEIEQAEFDGKWPEKPSGLCGWCPVKHCQHWRVRR